MRNPGDQRIRDLERRAHDDPEAAAALARARARAGHGTHPDVEAAIVEEIAHYNDERGFRGMGGARPVHMPEARRWGDLFVNEAPTATTYTVPIPPEAMASLRFAQGPPGYGNIDWSRAGRWLRENAAALGLEHVLALPDEREARNRRTNAVERDYKTLSGSGDESVLELYVTVQHAPPSSFRSYVQFTEDRGRTPGGRRRRPVTHSVPVGPYLRGDGAYGHFSLWVKPSEAVLEVIRRTWVVSERDSVTFSVHMRERDLAEQYVREITGTDITYGGERGVVLRYEPHSTGMTDTLVALRPNAREVWVASHELRRLDGSRLPARSDMKAPGLTALVTANSNLISAQRYLAILPASEVPVVMGRQ